MKEWRSKLAVSVVLGIAAVALLVRAVGRAPVPAPNAPASASASASPPVASADVGDAAAGAAMDASATDAAEADAGASDAAPDMAAPADAGPCARFAERTATALSAVEGALHGTDRKPPELCVPTARATWALVVERAILRRPWAGMGCARPNDAACEGIGFTLALVHVDAAGKETSVLPLKALHETWKLDGGTFIANATMAPMWGSVALTVLGAFDYDGDDDPEILLEGVAAEEGPDPRTFEAWTFRGGKIVAYAPLAGADVREVKDLDGDGRPDVLGAGPYARVDAESAIGGRYPVAPSFFAMHALPSGAFSRTDAVARAFSMSKCPAQPTLELGGSPLPTQFDEDVAHIVVCAKLWGATAADVAAAWKKVCGGVDASGGTDCQPWPKELGAIAPPFKL